MWRMESVCLRLVLDNSSIAAFTRGSIAVGELIGEVDDERGAQAGTMSSVTE